MLKHKEQMLERDLGIPADDLYRAWNYMAYPTSSNWVGLGDYHLAYPLYFKGMGERSIHVSGVPTTLGYQIFDSTDYGHPRFNYCRNQKLRLKCYPVGYWQQYAYNPNGCVGAPYYRFGLPTGTTVPTVPELIDWSLSDSASSRAWWEMQPRFQGDFDGLNFLFELKDFKNIAKSIAALRPSQIAETLKKARWAIRRAQSQVDRGTATSRAISTANAATRLASEAILIKHFAIDPTVRDLMTLYGQLQQLVGDVQHRFAEKGKTMNRRHYSEDIREVDNTTAYTRSSVWQMYGTLLTDKFTASMEFTYDYKVRDLNDAMKRYYGLELNAGVVWNAIPFTFLLDYVIGINDAINQMSTDPNVMLSMSQYCESRLVTVKAGRMFNGLCDQKYRWAVILNGKIALHRDIICGYEGSLYERRVVPPRKGMALPRLKMPSVKQAVNMVALARCMWN